VGLTQAQRSIIAKAQSVGASKQGVVLDDETCAYLVGVIAGDLGLLDKLPSLPGNLPPFFGTQSLESLRLPGVPFPAVFVGLAGLDPDDEIYFACLAAMHKGRLKYERILQTQPVPTVDQVGPLDYKQTGHPGTEFVRGHEQRFRDFLRGLVEEAAGKAAAKVAPAVVLLVEGAVVTALIQGEPDAAAVARDAALKLVSEAGGVEPASLFSTC
jgi:hypothetical protein